MKETITGAEALMRSLKSEGVKTIFGYPGGAIMPVFDALYSYTRGERQAYLSGTSRQRHTLRKVMPVCQEM